MEESSELSPRFDELSSEDLSERLSHGLIRAQLAGFLRRSAANPTLKSRYRDHSQKAKKSLQNDPPRSEQISLDHSQRAVKTPSTIRRYSLDHSQRAEEHDNQILHLIIAEWRGKRSKKRGRGRGEWEGNGVDNSWPTRARMLTDSDNVRGRIRV